jgi:thioredoxin/glutathione reductase (selenoprotein)
MSQDAANLGPVDPTEAGAPAKFDFDYLVIGGGSGGLASAKAASACGPEVALCDFVQPSTQGTKWGLGGTCVNVGCIPKKLFHTSSIMGELLHNSAFHYGWRLANKEAQAQIEASEEMAAMTGPKYVCDWNVALQNIDAHVRSINWGYVGQMKDKDVVYMNAYAKFVDRYTVETADKNGNKKLVTARRFLVATGGRPSIPSDVPGAKEFAITSDDIFWWKKDPKKTLVVGASYVALECAGFLNGLGRPTTVMIRSIPLRGFDQQCANIIVEDMKHHGCNFKEGCVPKKLEKLNGADGPITVTYEMKDGSLGTEEYDTVLFATGRSPETTKIGLDAVGVKTDPKSGKVIVDEWGRTSVSNIYAIGDIIQGGLELTPVAIKQGELLARRLYMPNFTKTLDMNLVPTTVFTPMEYGCCGYSEEAAEEKFGKENIEVYHSYMTQLEGTVPYEQTGFEHLGSNRLYMKLICNKKENEKVIGFHILSPNAGEITQGVAVAMRCGATKASFDETVGIHPTVAEEMTTLHVSKSSGLSAKKSAC